MKGALKITEGFIFSLNQTKRKNLISDLVQDLSDLFHVLPPQVKVFVFNIKEKVCVCVCVRVRVERERERERSFK